MTKLTKAEVFQRFEAALTILGDEDCEDPQADLRMKNVRELVKRVGQRPEIRLDEIANDVPVSS